MSFFFLIRLNAMLDKPKVKATNAVTSKQWRLPGK
jgi:hypothetical protein